MAEKIKKIIVALAGNPNSGKTTIFNSLTGMRQHVGNYPGVTVEKKQGLCRYQDYELDIIDLPGTYSLTAYSTEEVVTRNFIIEQKPDVVVDVIDASNIERNLYLAVQLMELNVPLVLAFNMSDIARQRGLVFDIEKLSTLLGVKIVQTVGNKQQGIDELLKATVEISQQPRKDYAAIVKYGGEIENEIEKLQQKFDELHNSRWIVIKLLEQDADVSKHIQNQEILSAVQNSIKHLNTIFAEEPEIIIADRRYGFISGACQEAVKNTIEGRHNRSDMIDTVITNKILGLPIFIALMYIVFDLTFRFGEWPMGWLESFFGWLGQTVTGFWPTGSDNVLKSLLVDGIIGGVGGVVVFLPNIMLLFAAIAILEDSGYMARAAFVTDRLMHKIGLHGKSFIPMLIGFGCSVPAIMACRILENRRNRITTILITPLMSCGARLTIYALIIPAFFREEWRGPVMWLIYFIGIALAVISAKILRITLLKGETIPYVMELPPYRMPTLKAVLIHMWERGWLYLKKAGTIILLLSIVLWVAARYPRIDVDKLANLNDTDAQTAMLKHSVIGRAGVTLEPILKPLGFDYKIATALIGALAAKEVFVAQMGIVYAVTEHEDVSVLQKKLSSDYTPLQGFCIMLFCLISAPCIATAVITRSETGAWKWAILQFGGLTAMAYIVTLVVYQAGMILSG
ncbi:MAG: ferrous iron transport protein B [Planctomycetes bacterium]|nr:ferrous iron transport protein B [Planctomycetota bacterium]MBU1518506.1 ferrous iron transport protein B [Planctomycetota bacterium]MBU2457964.1 ferrous iron transport protein B [Planctomycetota bacterium]